MLQRIVKYGILLIILCLISLPCVTAGTPGGESSTGRLAVNNGTFSPVRFEEGKPVIYFFFNQNCGECVKTHPFIDEFGRNRPDVVIHPVDIMESDENLALFHSFRDYYGTGFIPVPAVFVRNISLTGYDEITTGLADAVNGTWTNGSGEEIIPGGESPQSTLTVPLVILAGLVDGVNPCAFAVLIFLILSLISLESRSKMLVVGSVFIFAVFFFYFMSGLGIFAVVQSAGISRTISFIAAVIAIAAGLYSILSILGGEKGPALLSIPERGKGIIEPYIRKASIPAAFIVGILVGMFELPCTGGIYLAILSLISNRMSIMAGIPYLLLYNLFFILPLVIILGVFAFGLPIERLEQLQTGSRRGVRVLMGIVMILLGIILLFEII